MARVSDEQFREWRQHPVTKALRRFLGDYRLALRIEHADRWEAGQLGPPEFEAGKRGMAQACNDIATLEWGTVQEFYNINNEPGDTE